MSRKICFALAYAAILMGFTSLPSPADTILDDFQVNAEFPGHPPQDSPMSVANWQTQRIYTTFLSKHDGTNWDVALARHNYNLQPVGQTTYLNVREGTYNCQRPKLVIRSGGVGAAWIEARSPNHIMFRSLNGEGVPTCPPVRIEDNFDNVLRDSLSIAALSDGFLLVWYDARDSSKIWAQKVNLLGQLIGPNFPIQPDSTGSILGLEAQNHPDGRVLVSWVTNGQFSRGRWLDANGSFITDVFDMLEPWTTRTIGRSSVRFSIQGYGILYQHTTVYGPPWDRRGELYFTSIDQNALQIDAPALIDLWYLYADAGEYIISYSRSFPDILALSDWNYVSIKLHYIEYQPQWTLLYASLAGIQTTPYGLIGEGSYELCQINPSQFIYAFENGVLGLRKYEIATLDSLGQIEWVGEPGTGALQDKSTICVNSYGGLRVIYENHLGWEPYLYTRYFDGSGAPVGLDTLISRSTSGAPVFSSGARMRLTADDQALIIWPSGGTILGTSFDQNAGSGNVVNFSVSLGIPVPIAVPNFDVSSTNHLSLIWIHVSAGYEWLAGLLYIRPYEQLYWPLCPSFPVGPFFYEYAFLLEESCISLRGDGRFVAAWNFYWGGTGFGCKQSGTSYETLIGSPMAFDSLSGAASIERSSDGYWLAWRYEEQIKLYQLDSDGNFIDSIRIISSNDAIGAGDPDLAVTDSTDNFAIVWQDARNDSGDIYCRQFNPDGSFFGNEYRVNSDPVGVLQKEPAVACGPEDRLYFTWTDFRNPGGQGDIYCKVIEWEDALDAPVYTPPLPREFALYPPSPNPFNATTVIRFELPQAGLVKLQIFDISGREVGARHASPLQTSSGSGATPTMEWYGAGAHEVRFDGSGLASGVYIVRLQAGDYAGVEKMVLLK